MPRGKTGFPQSHDRTVNKKGSLVGAENQLPRRLCTRSGGMKCAPFRWVFLDIHVTPSRVALIVSVDSTQPYSSAVDLDFYDDFNNPGSNMGFPTSWIGYAGNPCHGRLRACQ